MPVIGLTGSIGTGKSTVAAMFALKGVKVIDADAITRELLTKDKNCIKKVAKSFPDAILNKVKINRLKLADIVFQNPRELQKLTKIIYPEALRKVKQQILSYKKQNPWIILDVPLLFEAGWDKLTDTTIVVKARRDQQITRVQQRMGLTKAQIQQRLKMQLPLRQKCQMADIIIDNSGTINQTRTQVSAIFHRLNTRKVN